MNRKYHVALTTEEKKYIEEIINNPKTCVTVRKRGNVLLMLDETVGKPLKQEEIALRCGVSDVTVYQVIKEYCTQGLVYALKFKKNPTPPNSPKIVGEIEAHLIALACSQPPTGFSKWTVRLLAKRMVELNIIESVCPETVRMALKKHNLNLT